MPNSKQPAKSRSAEDILREMEEMASDARTASPKAAPRSGSGLKSFLDFFVKVVPDETENPGPASGPAGRPSATPQAQPNAGPRTGPRVGDLVAGEPAPKFTVPKSAATDLSQKPFEELYREAGVADSSCSVDDLAKLMDNPAVANQPLSVKVIAVNLTLASKGIGQEVPITDAVRRDRALDAFQEMLTTRASQTEQQHQQKIEQLTRETEEYLKHKQVEIEALRAEVAEAKRQSVDFALRRQAEEKRLADLVSPFLEGHPNPVTVGNQLGQAGQATQVGLGEGEK